MPLAVGNSPDLYIGVIAPECSWHQALAIGTLRTPVWEEAAGPTRYSFDGESACNIEN